MTLEALGALSGAAGLTSGQADHMIENAVGVFGLPLGVAMNFVVNGREVLVPMAIEEPSVVAGASFMAKLARAGGGFKATSSEPQMIAQLQVLDLKDPDESAPPRARPSGRDPGRGRSGGPGHCRSGWRGA